MDGIINVLKQPGGTSHDIVNQVRKILKTKKVGHTGTLDPDAVGVLPLCIGKATRLAEYLSSAAKRYRALICFGYETDTQDGSGQVTKKTDLPIVLEDELLKVLESFIGELEQVPPMFSAVKINGQPLYKLAREGKEIARQSRIIEIYDLKLINYNQHSALIDVTCSKGTYIRTLCEEIGKALNSSAYMSFLLRVQSGVFHIDSSYTLDEIKQLEANKFLIKMADSLPDLQELDFSEDDIVKISHGNKVIFGTSSSSVLEGIKYKVLDKNKELLAVGILKDNYFKPVKVFR